MNWLTYQENVKKTPAITRSVALMDPYFEGEPSVITSGWRAPMDQIRIIIEKAKKHGIDNEFSEFKQPNVEMREPEISVLINDKPLFWWQRTWSQLLFLNDIVNPPIAAECLFDYVRPGETGNKKGQIIQPSPHQRGLSLDIGGGSNLDNKEKRVIKAMQSGECFIHSFLKETVNNAIHIDVFQIG